MLKTREQYKKAIIKHRVLTGLIGLAFIGGITASVVSIKKIDKNFSSLIENSQGYKDYYNQTQKNLLDNGEITEEQYQENIKKGPDDTNYNLYINKDGTKKEIDNYYKLERNRILSLVCVAICAAYLPIHFCLSSLKTQAIKRDYKENQEKIELIDNDKNQL